MPVEVRGLGIDGHRQAQQAAGRRAQGAGMVRMGAAGREGDSGGAGRFGDARERAEVARVLQAVEVEIGAAGEHRQGLDAAAGQPRHGEEAARRVGVGEVRQHVRAHFQRRDGKGGGEPPSRGGIEKGRRRQDLLDGDPRGQGCRHQVRPFEQRQLAFTSPEPPNILEPLILPAGDHEHGS